MRLLKVTALMFFAAALAMPAAITSVMQRQTLTTRPESFQSRLERFQHTEVVEDEDSGANANATEAPTGFDNLTNGFDEQEPGFAQKLTKKYFCPKSPSAPPYFLGRNKSLH